MPSTNEFHPGSGMASWAFGNADDELAKAKAEIGELQEQVDRLTREISDLRNELLTSNEHGDLLQDHLYRLSTSLAAEVQERQATEQKLRDVLTAITQEKGDLEILVQILIDQGDSFAEEGEKAHIDGLTQIPNRRRFDEFLLRQWRQHARVSQPLSLLLCDVDHFKLYNDSYGHQRGDECLRAVAFSIKSCLRGDDLVARYGGEEFAIVLPRTPAKRAARVAERIRLGLVSMAIPHAFSPVLENVTISIGIASATPGANDPDAHALIEEADRKLYLAKQRGRNCIMQ